MVKINKPKATRTHEGGRAARSRRSSNCAGR